MRLDRTLRRRYEFRLGSRMTSDFMSTAPLVKAQHTRKFEYQFVGGRAFKYGVLESLVGILCLFRTHSWFQGGRTRNLIMNLF